MRSIVRICLLLWAANQAALGAEHDATPRLLEPTGAHRVGQILLDWTDTSREEPGTPESDDRRQIPVQIWYPAAADSAAEIAPYRPRVEAFRSSWGDESVDLLQSVRTTWLEGAPLDSGGPFPVLLFSHGWSARSSSHGTLLANLASRGFVVVGINHPFLGQVALADGRVTEPNDSQFANQAEANAFYAADVHFVIDQVQRMNLSHPILRGSMDPSRIGAMGHSSGFPAVSSAAVADSRIRALVSLDAGVPKVVRSEGLDVPILLVRADSDSYTDLFFRGPETHPKGTIYDVSFFRAHRAAFFDLVIQGTTHSSVYDQYLFTDSPSDAALSKRNHALMGELVSSFFVQALAGIDPTALIDLAERSDHCTLRIIPAG